MRKDLQEIAYEDGAFHLLKGGYNMKENLILTLVFGGFILACTTWQWLGVVMVVVGLAIK